MEGMTGFNPIVASQNIKEFQESVEGIYWKLQDAIGEFSFSLSSCWASPKAVDFKSKVKPMFDELFQEMSNSSMAIVHGATSAYNTAARANGAQTIADISEGFFDATDFAEMLDNKDGVVGMNVETVKGHLADFKERMISCVDMFDNVKTSIALYDDENGQQKSYAAGVNRFKNNIISTMEATVKIVEDAIETEAQVVFNAAQDAATTLTA